MDFPWFLVERIRARARGAHGRLWHHSAPISPLTRVADAESADCPQGQRDAPGGTVITPPAMRCRLSGSGEANGMSSNEPRGPRQILRALVWSAKGLRAAWTHEASFRLEGYLFVILFPLGLWIGDGMLEKAMLCGSLLLVLSAELLNSAVEAVVDKVSPEFHELAGRAKDMGSAAVFLLMVNVVLCWGLWLWQR